MKRRILFVDDEASVLQGLRRLVWSVRDQWDAAFADSGRQALALIQAQPFDVVVTDVRMPGMNGVELLERIKRDHPHTVRIVLSGQSSHADAIRIVGPAHQFLAKPCFPELLWGAISRACALRELLTSDRLQSLVSGLGSLPSPPTVYLRLVKELQSEHPSTARIHDIVSHDAGMVARILQVANSAFFGFRCPITDPQRAITLMGLAMLAPLVLSQEVFGRSGRSRTELPNLDELADHSFAVGAIARAIATSEGLRSEEVAQCFTAGLLHDVGRLVLAMCPDCHAKIAALPGLDWRRRPLEEREALGACHGQVGAYLLGLWGLPDCIVEAVAFHHEPTAAGGVALSPLAIVHAADVLEHGQRDAGIGESEESLLAPLLASLNLGHRLGDWQTLAADAIGKLRDGGFSS